MVKSKSNSKSSFKQTGIYAVKLSKNGLSGYSSKLKKSERHLALKKLIKQLIAKKNTKCQAIVKLIRRLNIIAIYHKNKNPKVSKIYRQDITFLQGKKLTL